MTPRTACATALLITIGCASDPSNAVTTLEGSDDAVATSAADSGAAGSGGGPVGTTAGGDTPGDTGDGGGADANTEAGGSDGAGDSGGDVPPWDAGNPDGSCSTGVSPFGTPVDTSTPTTVVGTGTPESCTHAALAAAVASGGIITFDCGTSPVTIAVDATLELRTDVDTVIDGGRLVTLDGQHQVRVLSFDSPDFMANEIWVTLQHLRIVGGKTSPVESIPEAPPPCSQGFNDGEGGALYMRDGNLRVIDCIFTDNEAAPLGLDTGGGAIYVLGSKHGMVIASSTFADNRASNAAAIGGLFCPLDIYDSLFTGNTALGNGANSDDASQCSAINNGQHEVGSGGNGGAIYSDGMDVDVSLCGVQVTGNAAGDGAFGGGLFFTSNNFGGDLTIRDTTMVDNTGGYWTIAQNGDVGFAGTAVGTNCNSITIENSTLQGL